jgi:hypothetical protein
MFCWPKTWKHLSLIGRMDGVSTSRSTARVGVKHRVTNRSASTFGPRRRQLSRDTARAVVQRSGRRSGRFCGKRDGPLPRDGQSRRPDHRRGPQSYGRLPRGGPAEQQDHHARFKDAGTGLCRCCSTRNLEVVARSINNDPSGGAEFDLGGVAIDHVEVQATKNPQGALDSVTVTMRATEQLTVGSVTAGTRLAVVDANGTVVRTSTAPTYTLRRIHGEVDAARRRMDHTSQSRRSRRRTPVSLSIAATNTLRSRSGRWTYPSCALPIAPSEVHQYIHRMNRFEKTEWLRSRVIVMPKDLWKDVTAGPRDAKVEAEERLKEEQAYQQKRRP